MRVRRLVAIAARYALTTFSITLNGGHHTVLLGELRDSAHAAVTTAPALFSSSPVTVHPRLAAYEAAYPTGEL